MENNNEKPSNSNSNPNRKTTFPPENSSVFSPENHSSFFPETNSNSGLFPENYSGFLPENSFGFLPENSSVFLPENHSGFPPENHQHPYPVLNPSRLNPSYDRDSLLAEYFDSLNLSVPRHRPVGPNESFRAQGQNRNLYPQDDINMMINGFSGRPESVYNSWDNGSLLGPNQNGMFNGPNGLNLYRNNRVNGSRFEPGHSSWPSPNPLNGPNGPSPNRNNLLLDPLYWTNGPAQGRIRPNTSQNRLFRDSMYASNGPTRNNGLFSKPVYSSSRPIMDYEPGRVGPSRLNRASGGPGAEYINRELKEFRGKIKLMAKNRDGSAFLKKKIEEGAEGDFELIFEEVKDDVAGLMVNYFGNTVVQKLFKICGPEQISYVLGLLIRVKYQFAEICCDNHGSLAMEKLLQNLRTREQRSLIISTLRGIVLNLSKDQNGLKVVQYCILHFPENVDVLINEIADDCFGAATHKSGCVILQDCLGRADGEMMERLMSELGPNVLLLSEHPYGNYVVQYLLDKNNPSITGIILSWLAGNFVSLSMNKCSSNVVEKCLITAREDEASEIILELMNSDNFKMVIQDPYGNYVVQKALEVSQNMRQSEIQMRLENRIMSLYGSLNTHPFGNRVVSKLKQHRPNNFG